MKVRPGGAPAGSHVADNLAALHLLPRTHCKTRKVSVECLDPVAMIDQDLPAVSAGQSCGQNDSVRGGMHRLSEARRDVDSRMEGTFTVEGILSLTEGTGNWSHHRPERRRIRHTQPVVAAQGTQAGLKGVRKPAGQGRAPKGGKLIEGFGIGGVSEVVVRIVCVSRNRNCVHSCRALELVMLQAVEGGHFAGEGA